jgi:hypothetical protein
MPHYAVTLALPRDGYATTPPNTPAHSARFSRGRQIPAGEGLSFLGLWPTGVRLRHTLQQRIRAPRVCMAFEHREMPRSWSTEEIS